MTLSDPEQGVRHRRNRSFVPWPVKYEANVSFLENNPARRMTGLGRRPPDVALR